MNITEELIRKIASKELDIKKVFPEVFNFTGWAKDKNYKEWLGYYENNILQYGFSINGNWFSVSCHCQHDPNTEYPATHEEIKNTLVREAKKRGHEFDSYLFETFTNYRLYGWSNNNLTIIFEKGTWAEVKKSPKYFLVSKEDLYLINVTVYERILSWSNRNKKIAIIFESKEKAEAMNTLLDNKYKLEEI